MKALLSLVVSKLEYDRHFGTFTWICDGRLAGFKVSAGRYWGIGIGGRTYRASRLAWFYVTGKWPSGHIDHINGNRMDDRIMNLRDVSQRENNSNLDRHRSGNLVGASLSYRKNAKNKWMSRIKIAGQNIWLGCFKTQQEAHARYKQELEARHL